MCKCGHNLLMLYCSYGVLQCECGLQSASDMTVIVALRSDRVDSADELLQLVSRAPRLHVPNTASSADASTSSTSSGVATTIISDAGRTQVAAGSVTVAAFLGRKPQVDAVTGHLKLL